MEQKSIAELWARGVNDRVNQKEKPQNTEQIINPAPIKPVQDKAVEGRKAQFRQNILNNNNKQKEQPNG